MHRTAGRLGDGREIIYYSRDPGRTAAPPDPRQLIAGGGASEVRRDPVTGDWVVVAGHRQTRTFQPAAAECPLCPSRDGRQTEIPAQDYDVVVFENRFPALTPIEDGAAASAVALFESGPANGRCEVVCFSSEHDSSFAELKPDQARLVLDVWADRSRELARVPGVAQVFCFENRGSEMGTTQPHPHGQIYAFPFVTARTQRMLDHAGAYRRSHDRNLFGDLIAAELADGERVVLSTVEWVAMVPFAARWPYEVHLYPRRRRRALPDLDDAQRDGFADAYLDLLQRFDRLHDSPAPYISAWHQAPTAEAAGAEDFALHLELFTNRRATDKLKVLGGTELVLGAFSNDIGPEAAARRLRELAR